MMSSHFLPSVEFPCFRLSVSDSSSNRAPAKGPREGVSIESEQLHPPPGQEPGPRLRHPVRRLRHPHQRNKRTNRTRSTMVPTYRPRIPGLASEATERQVSKRDLPALCVNVLVSNGTLLRVWLYTSVIVHSPVRPSYETTSAAIGYRCSQLLAQLASRIIGASSPRAFALLSSRVRG